MTAAPSSPTPGTTVLLFGSQALFFNETSLDQLRSTLLGSSDHKWAVEAISEFPDYWETISKAFPQLQSIPGAKLVEDLKEWLKTGKLTQTFFPLPNILLTPLTVISQLVQYSRYLETQLNPGERESLSSAFQQDTETLGHCTGLLSAFAIASSATRSQLEKYSSVAVRQAILIGALVDAQDKPYISQWTGPSTSFATAWNSSKVGDELARILDQFAEAYISVLYDENRATITTSESTAPILHQQLKAVGATISEVGLRGRFHCKCHEGDIESVIAFCDSNPEFQFPDASELKLPTYSNSSGEYIKEGKLHHVTLKSILIKQSSWYKTFATILSSRLGDKESLLVSFGPERCVPPSLIRRIGSRVIHVPDHAQPIPRISGSVSDPIDRHFIGAPDRSDSDIAVIGMACKVAGADDLEEFWKILCEGKSQHVEIDESRLSFETHWRENDSKRKWYGNFVKDNDAFDHKFFKKSPREVVSQDPQQRLMMQIAYQAVEQSGYFSKQDVDKNIGCYLGVCATDYENNIACHPPNAFAATGNLRSFIAGKVSHYFGWTGPGMTIDSACSASAVSIHQACQAILSGECTAALAGGVNMITNPLWFQNLAGASFLSPTGACKPFDANADGYCRGEGIAAVFLKKMSTAIADGDEILGCIAGTAVSQNDNCTPIFVPNASSLSTLFGKVTQKAHLEPKQISVVEAHGTGTPVGDPAEYESILKVFGGPVRSSPLPIGSVKGLVGHTESASGVIALIKMILMIQEGVIPPQASFQTLSPHIKASPSDMMEIVTRKKLWDASFKAALINNYGASGSNASIIVTQPFSHDQYRIGTSPIQSSGVSHPFWICGLDERSLQEYAARLSQFIRDKVISAKSVSIANIAFNVSRQSNRSLAQGFIFSCRSITELENRLAAFVNGDSSLVIVKSARPVILCFGGQISTFVGLDRTVYESVKILRGYLDQCNSALLSLGLDSIYPRIFQRAPIEDAVKIQTMLFAIQYSCAKTWIDCGAQVSAVVGHSFGELTALCVTGILSLKDTLKLISSRARLVRDLWGPDKGSMMAVEGDLEVVNKLLAESKKVFKGEQVASIACFNGPRSFTLAGPVKSIDAVVEVMRINSDFTSVKTKKLNVSNAFHSSLVDPLMGELEKVAQSLTFKEPELRLERATESASTEKLTSEFAATHMRYPVYFSHAVQRLSKDFPSAIWLEAGSNSTITSMASRALESPSDSHFQPINITSDNALQNLTTATMNLWKEGLRVSFWAHHTSQTYEYAPLILPPYQFAKAKHWLEVKKPQKAIAQPQPVSPAQAQVIELPTNLWTFIQYNDNKQQSARFRINTMIEKYENFISGHMIAQTAPICPATLQVDMAIEALLSLRPEFATPDFQPSIQGVDNLAPICVDPSRLVWLDLEANHVDSHTWSWKIFSTGSQIGTATTIHVTGKIIFRAVDDLQYQLDFARYERLVGHQRCLRILNANDADDIIQGRNIYKTFGEIVDYGDLYRGLQKLVGKDNESAGRVVKKYTGETWLDTHLSDCFSQVGGIWVNCMTDRAPTDMYIANGFEQWMRSPKLRSGDPRPEVWDVFAFHNRPSEKAFITDIFIFDSSSGTLMEVILGINYARVSKSSMSKILSRLSAGGGSGHGLVAPPLVAANMEAPQATTTLTVAPKPTKPVKAPKIKEKKKSPEFDITNGVKLLLAHISGLEPDEIKFNTELADIGIDSLMGMELAHDIEGAFKCEIPTDNLMEVTNFESLVKCISSALGTIHNVSPDEESDEDSTSEDDSERSSESQVADTLASETSVTASSAGNLNVVEYLAELLGVPESDVSLGILLRDLGVDSLLSTEVRSDLSSKFDVHISEDVSIEELTVEELSVKINGASGAGSNNSIPAPLPASVSAPEKEIERAPKVQRTDTSLDSTLVSSAGHNLDIPASAILEAFGESKLLTDQFIADYRCADYIDTIMPKQNELCVALTVEAFEQLGCSLRTAKANQKLERITYLPRHRALADYLYEMLDKGARLINIEGSRITRTAVSLPTKSSDAILRDLMRNYPDHGYANKLTHFTGSKLADVLTGKCDGIKLIFGTEEGRNLVGGLYGDSLLNKLSYKQMEHFIKGLISKLPKHEGPLKILEMGAGTGGTTKGMVPLLASLNFPVEYTFTDLSPSMVAGARKKFKEYPFMKFRVHDIEKQPADDLLNSQHIIIASNAVHATHSLTESTENIRKALRLDGFLMMLEMTETIYWIDIIFGILEGWWLFEDGRQHAIANQFRWDRDLRSVGYSHVDWTDGNRPEVNIQRLIIALASGSSYDRLPIPPKAVKSEASDWSARQVTIDEYVRKSTQGFSAPVQLRNGVSSSLSSQCVLITGATGSLGSHLVAHLAQLPNIKTVICLNRPSGKIPETRQQEALESRGISLDSKALAKLKVLEADTSKSMLGLPHNDYDELLDTVTHILHNAWPMSGKRPLKGFESQFQVMRNLVNFASEIASRRPQGSKVSFQLISSIAVVGHYPLWTGSANVPEERVDAKSVLPNGYGDAKFVCEKILDETLHKYPEIFRTMTVRPGQVAGSKTSGYWNPMEHLSFLVKSSQTLKALPDFDGPLSWTPVNDVAACLGDLLLTDNTPYPIYHIDNPVRQPWRDMIILLAEVLHIPQANIIPFPEWIKRVRHFPSSTNVDNPAAKLLEFLDENFLRMSCGGLLLDTTKSREHSKALSNVGPVGEDIVRKYIQAWKDTGFLFAN